MKDILTSKGKSSVKKKTLLIIYCRAYGCTKLFITLPPWQDQEFLSGVQPKKTTK